MWATLFKFHYVPLKYLLYVYFQIMLNFLYSGLSQQLNLSRSFIFVELYILCICRPFAGRNSQEISTKKNSAEIYFYKLQVYISTRKILRIYIVLPEKFHKNISITQKFYKNIVRQKYISTSKILQIYIGLQIYISVNKIVFTLKIYISTRKSLQKYFSTIELNCILIEEFGSRLFMSIKLLNYVLENDLEIGGQISQSQFRNFRFFR